MAYWVTANPDTAGDPNGTLTIAGQSMGETRRVAHPRCAATRYADRATYNKDAADGTVRGAHGHGAAHEQPPGSASWVTFPAGHRRDGRWQCVLSSLTQPGYDRPHRGNQRSPASAHRQTIGRGAGRMPILGRTRRRQQVLASGDVTTTVATQPNCSWTASPDASWLERVKRMIRHRNWRGHRDRSQQLRRPAREVGFQVRWPTPTLGQNVRIAQAGCS